MLVTPKIKKPTDTLKNEQLHQCTPVNGHLFAVSVHCLVYLLVFCVSIHLLVYLLTGQHRKVDQSTPENWPSLECRREVNRSTPKSWPVNSQLVNGQQLTGQQWWCGMEKGIFVKCVVICPWGIMENIGVLNVLENPSLCTLGQFALYSFTRAHACELYDLRGPEM